MTYFKAFSPLLFILFSLYSCKNTGQLADHTQHKYTNALINETSPYLLQHAHNPVDWHPWNEETLAKAQKEDKLLIISIGYSACHWCHVMEHESFEDEEVATFMNEHFFPIKVDREERPDVDDVYMTACQLVSGRGGWPLNAFALPDGRPIWAGTYFPKDRWFDILKQFAELKTKQPEKLEETAANLTSGVNSTGTLELATVPEKFSNSQLRGYVNRMNELIDNKDGGRTGAPKFPMPNNYELLLKYGHIYKDDQSIQSTMLTLDKMARGGIYDQVGGGFARYSVDAMWKVPHFEKMLYDNGQLIGLYSTAYRLNPKPLYKKVVEQSVEFIERELTSPEGGFYSSLDADSEGEEGLFYIWTESELDSLLTESDLSATAKAYYSTSPEGNWEHSNILHITKLEDAIAKALSISTSELEYRVNKINNILLKAREDRIRPGLDDKILTGWNALMISGYVEAFKAFQKEEYLQKALKNANFLVDKQIQNDFRVNRNYKEGKSTINGFLDDYAHTIKAFVDLYEVTLDEKWLNTANGLTDYVLDNFDNEQNQMLYLTSDIDKPLISRSAEYPDNVIPGTNSTMARNLMKLGQMTYNKKYTTRAQQMLSNMVESIQGSGSPGFYSNWLQLWVDQVRSPYEIVIMGKNATDKTKKLQRNYLANSIILGSRDNKSDLPLLENKYVEGSTMIYVCENKVCQLPTTDVLKAIGLVQF